MSAQSNDAGSITLNIAKEFTDSPGGRYRKDGRYSGEAFLDTLLRPAYEKAKAKGQKLVIELDDVYGYPSSFVSGSFGLLASECNQRGEDLLSHLKFVSSSPTRISRFEAEINDPKQRQLL